VHTKSLSCEIKLFQRKKIAHLKYVIGSTMSPPSSLRHANPAGVDVGACESSMHCCRPRGPWPPPSLLGRRLSSPGLVSCRQPKRRLAVDGRTSHLAVASPHQASACTPRHYTMGAPATVSQEISQASAVLHTHRKFVQATI
jgi:hypothetical protein